MILMLLSCPLGESHRTSLGIESAKMRTERDMMTVYRRVPGLEYFGRNLSAGAGTFLSDVRQSTVRAQSYQVLYRYPGTGTGTGTW